MISSDPFSGFWRMAEARGHASEEADAELEDVEVEDLPMGPEVAWDLG